MSERRLPGGGKPWFVRVRAHTRYKINPCSAEGWWVLIGYCLFLSIAPHFALWTGGTPLSWVNWVGFAALIVVPSAIFILVLLRKSLPLNGKETRK